MYMNDQKCKTLPLGIKNTTGYFPKPDVQTTGKSQMPVAESDPALVVVVGGARRGGRKQAQWRQYPTRWAVNYGLVLSVTESVH